VTIGDGYGPDTEVVTCMERVCANCDARTRLKGAEFERAKNVAWLRSSRHDMSYTLEYNGWRMACKHMADAIERGEQ
jgi:hypothetical protein